MAAEEDPYEQGGPIVPFQELLALAEEAPIVAEEAEATSSDAGWMEALCEHFECPPTEVAAEALELAMVPAEEEDAFAPLVLA